MRRAVLLILILAAAIGGLMVWTHRHKDETKADESAAHQPVDEKSAEEEPRLKHDELGRTVVVMNDETQGNIGLMVAKPAAAQVIPEVKGYGRVLDVSVLAALLNELASNQAASTVSSSEWARLKTLAPQGNATERALQAAEATAKHDQLAVQSALDRLVWAWGRGVADQTDLPGFIQSLTSHKAALARVDLPAGETLKTAPTGVRLVTLSGDSVEGEFLDTTSSVDPQTLGRGWFFLVKTNSARLLAGEPLTGYIKVPGEPISGILIPREAVVRTEGLGWVYIMNAGGASFTRIGITLDHPTETAWFITKGVTTNDYVVVTGAQVLLSEEQKGSAKPD